MGDEDEQVRLNASLGLGVIGDPTAVPVLIEALRNENSKVRSRTAEALRHMGVWARTGRPAISYQLDCESSDYAALTEALSAIGDPMMLPALIEAVTNKFRGMQGSAIEALGVMISVKRLRNLSVH